MNLMLAVVNETFTSAERDKFKKLYLHKRRACQHAFKLLVSKQNPEKMRFRQFEGLMRYYAPHKGTIVKKTLVYLVLPQVLFDLVIFIIVTSLFSHGISFCINSYQRITLRMFNYAIVKKKAKSRASHAAFTKVQWTTG